MIRYTHRWLFGFVVLGLSFAPLDSAQTVDVTSANIEELNRAFDAGTLTSELLVGLYLARIEAYDEAGPNLNAVITLNPRASERARALDAERRSNGPRSPLHGIPIVLKDNIDTADLPTTAGSNLLAGSIPADDAFLVRKLREAGAIVLAKLNMSEFASGGAINSLGGPTRNPHDLVRSPAGSSGGTGASIAAAFAQVGLGTDTGGSIRGPSTANGIVGLKPTHGLIGRDGIIPLALSFDTVGPMARHVYDVAAALGVMTGIDPGDDATLKSEGRFETDYTQYLDADALNGARFGIARDFLGQDADVDWVIEASLEVIRDAGATVVDVHLPEWLLRASAVGEGVERRGGSDIVYRQSPVVDQVRADVEVLSQEVFRRPGLTTATAGGRSGDGPVPAAIEKLGVQCLAVAPLMTLRHRLGILFAGRRHPDAFPQADAAVLLTLAGHLATGIENLRLYRTLKQYSDNLEGLVAERTEELSKAEARHRMLLEVNNAIIANLDKRSLFEAVSQTLGKTLSFDRASLTLLDPETDILQVYALADSLPPDQGVKTGTRISTGRKPPGSCLRAETTADPPGLTGGAPHWLGESPARAGDSILRLGSTDGGVR